jgi:hypothetical protein
MKSQNKITRFLLTIGGILLLMGLLSLDLNDFSYDFNKKSYFKIISGILLLFICFIKIYF